MAKPDPLQAVAAAAMADCLCMGARTATRRIVNFYEARLAPHGLGIAQFGLMASIAAEGEGSISRLAERLELDPSTLSRTLRPLEEQGLIEIFADPENLRVRRVRLTAEGRARAMRASQAWAKAQKHAVAILKPDLIEKLLAASGKLSAL